MIKLGKKNIVHLTDNLVIIIQNTIFPERTANQTIPLVQSIINSITSCTYLAIYKKYWNEFIEKSLQGF